MVIEQTIDIPVDHRVFFEFLAPQELPAGPARLELTVTPLHEEPRDAEADGEGLAVKSDIPLADILADIAAQLGHVNIEQILEEGRLKDAGLFTGKSTTPHADFLSGILAGAGDITLEQIREERRRKYMV